MARLTFTGRTVLVTGASSGVGRAIVWELARRGARTAVSARRLELLEVLAREVAEQGWPIPAVLPADLSVRGSAADLAARAVDALGGVDILVNNAGAGVGGSQCAIGDRDEGREAFETNFWSPLALTKALVPGMRERGVGAIVNVTSLAQVMPWPGLGHYSSTKAALAIATETLRAELGGTGVRVLEVILGPVDTAVLAESRLLPGFGRQIANVPRGTARVASRVAIRALERGRSRVVYPRRLAAAYALPFAVRLAFPVLVRRYAPPDLIWRELPDDRVVRSGSQGAAEARAARLAWEAGRSEP